MWYHICPNTLPCCAAAEFVIFITLRASRGRVYMHGAVLAYSWRIYLTPSPTAGRIPDICTGRSWKLSWRPHKGSPPLVLWERTEDRALLHCSWSSSSNITRAWSQWGMSSITGTVTSCLFKGAHYHQHRSYIRHPWFDAPRKIKRKTTRLDLHSKTLLSKYLLAHIFLLRSDGFFPRPQKCKSQWKHAKEFSPKNVGSCPTLLLQSCCPNCFTEMCVKGMWTAGHHCWSNDDPGSNGEDIQWQIQWHTWQPRSNTRTWIEGRVAQVSSLVLCYILSNTCLSLRQPVISKIRYRFCQDLVQILSFKLWRWPAPDAVGLSDAKRLTWPQCGCPKEFWISVLSKSSNLIGSKKLWVFMVKTRGCPPRNYCTVLESSADLQATRFLICKSPCRPAVAWIGWAKHLHPLGVLQMRLLPLDHRSH